MKCLPSTLAGCRQVAIYKEKSDPFDYTIHWGFTITFLSCETNIRAERFSSLFASLLFYDIDDNSRVDICVTVSKSRGCSARLVYLL